MHFWYIIFPFIVWLVSQSIKFFIRLSQKQLPSELKKVAWVFIWAGGAPSTHTAMLTSTLVLVWNHFGFSPIFTFCLVITMLWLYDMATDRKRQEIFNSYIEDEKAGNLQKIVSDGFLLDLAGHTTYEIAWGTVLGLGIGWIAISFI